MGSLSKGICLPVIFVLYSNLMTHDYLTQCLVFCYLMYHGNGFAEKDSVLQIPFNSILPKGFKLSKCSGFCIFRKARVLLLSFSASRYG